MSDKPGLKDQTLFVKNLECAYQAIFERLTTSQTMLEEQRLQNLLSDDFWKVQKQIFDEHCFATWPYIKTICFTSKIQLFDQLRLII